jgi:hypothetical protein
MIKKICKDCNTEKNINEFYKNKTSKDGYNNDCRECFIIKRKTYRKEYSKEYEKRDNVKKYRKTFDKKNKERRKTKYYENVELNREINRIARKKQRDKDRIGLNIKRRNYYRHKMKTDPLFKLKKNVRNRIWSYTKYNGKSKTTFEIVGLTAEELKIHLENQFIGEMNWENYGTWHIDHIIPLDSAVNEKELYNLCYYTNLQPMWGNENIRKGSKILFL